MKCRNIEKIELPKWLWEKKKPITKDYPIKSLDTETFNDDKDVGKCFLIADSDSDYKIIHNFEDCLNFLLRKKYQNSINFWYNIKYDTNAILKHLPKKHIESLILYDQTIFFFRGKEIKISIIPDKLLKFQIGHHTIKFFDLAQFYDKQKLEKIAYKVQSEKKYIEDISSISRYKFYHNEIYRNEIIDRCITDSQIQQKLAVLINDTYKKFCSVRNYYSSASIARQYILQNLEFDKLPLPSSKIMGMALNAYNAGRFEVFQKGFFPKMYEYDINSAYPEIIKDLAVTEGIYKYNYQYEPESLYSYFNIDCEIYDTVISPLKFQTKNNLLIYPNGKFKNIWIDKSDYESIYNSGFNIKINEAGHLFNDEPIFPFKYIEDTYYYRKEVEKNDKELANAIKRTLNSIYGVFINVNIQKVFTTEDSNNTDFIILDDKIYFINKKFIAGNMFNPLFACTVTSKVRNKLYNDFLKYDDKVIAFATDGVKLTDKVNIKQSDKLGGYKREDTKDNILIGSGVYQIETKEKIKTKFRGFDVDLNLKDLLEKNLNKKTISQISRKVLSMKTCYRTHILDVYDDNDTFIESKNLDLDDINRFVKIEKNLNINFDKKREWERDFINCKDVLENTINSLPLTVSN